MKKILILGMDGYLGWPLAIELAKQNYIVNGIDNFSRRKMVEEIGSCSAIPIYSIDDRIEALNSKNVYFNHVDLNNYNEIDKILSIYTPDTIVHLAEMPSAPYSMIDREHAIFTHNNNINGTLNLLFAMRKYCPNAHLIKLGTMGEYGTPNIDIPEGFIDMNYNGRSDKLLFPRKPGSWYHLTKVHSSYNIQFACNIWGLKSTDIMQGPVYGVKTIGMGDNEKLFTRFDFDECFGTVINRFCAQAIAGINLTVYGKGNQTRGFITIKDSMQCLKLIIDNPPDSGEYRIFNQFEETYNMNELAELVQASAVKLGIDVSIDHINNPRIEKEEHYYNPICKYLADLGYKPMSTIEQEISETLKILMYYKDRIINKSNVILPKIKWK